VTSIRAPSSCAVRGVCRPKPFDWVGTSSRSSAFPCRPLEVPGKLTPVEKLVVRALLQGKTNRQIARERGVALSTVLNQLKAVFRKLRVASRWELAAMCRAR
jgi:DNA-binding NarL/FixJ family response regulator